MDDNKAKKMRAALLQYSNLQSEVAVMQNRLQELAANDMTAALGHLTVNSDDWEAVRTLLHQRWDRKRAEAVVAMETL